MSSGEYTITQYDDPHGLCQFWDNSASAFIAAYYLPTISMSGSSFTLWGQKEDRLYVGKVTPFAYVGFRPASASVGSYGNFSLFYSITSTAYVPTCTAPHTITVATDLTAKFKDGNKFKIAGSTGNDGEYTCNGDSVFGAVTTITVNETVVNSADGTILAHSIWAPLTALFNNTVGFTESGYIAWSIPGAWGLSTVNSESGYWIRAQPANDVTAAVTAYHLRRNLTLAAPIHCDGPTFERERVYADINGALCKKDLTYAGPTKLTLMITQMACSMGNLQLLHDWEYYRNDLYLTDGADSASVDPAADAYYRDLQGKLISVPVEMRSPSKMGLSMGAYYPLVFAIDTVITQSSLLGLSL